MVHTNMRHKHTHVQLTAPPCNGECVKVEMLLWQEMTFALCHFFLFTALFYVFLYCYRLLLLSFPAYKHTLHTAVGCERGGCETQLNV